MRRITTWLLSTVSALVLLFSYHTSTSSRPSTAILGPLQSGGTGSTGGAAGTSGAGGAAGSSGTTGSTGGPAGGSGTPYTGDVVDTRWGPVQVRITVAGGKITKVDVLQVPWNNNRDMQINSYAVPIYNQEAVQTQSAKIDMISGATVTYDGYVGSLQSAIDKAHL